MIQLGIHRNHPLFNPQSEKSLNILENKTTKNQHLKQINKYAIELIPFFSKDKEELNRVSTIILSKKEVFENKLNNLNQRKEIDLNMYAEVYGNLAVHIFSLAKDQANFELACKYYSNSLKMNYFHYASHYAEAALRLSKLDFKNLQDILPTISALQRACLFSLPNTNDSKQCLEQVVTAIKMKWGELIEKKILSSEQQKKYIESLEIHLKYNNPLSCEKIPFKHVPFAPIHFLKNHPQYLSEAHLKNSEQIFTIPETQTDPKELVKYLFKYLGLNHPSIKYVYIPHLTPAVFEVVKYFALCNPYIQICAFDQELKNMARESLTRELYSIERFDDKQQRLIRSISKDPDAQFLTTTTAHPNLPVYIVSLCTKTKREIIKITEPYEGGPDRQIVTEIYRLFLEEKYLQSYRYESFDLYKVVSSNEFVAIIEKQFNKLKKKMSQRN